MKFIDVNPRKVLITDFDSFGEKVAFKVSLSFPKKSNFRFFDEGESLSFLVVSRDAHFQVFSDNILIVRTSNEDLITELFDHFSHKWLDIDYVKLGYIQIAIKPISERNESDWNINEF